MKTARLPARHGDDHRPRGTLGPDDPGGYDPVTVRTADYVFLEEIVVANDGDPIEFADIAQTFRHLEFKGRFAVPNSPGPFHLQISANGGDRRWAFASMMHSGDDGFETDSDIDLLGARSLRMLPNVAGLAGDADVLLFAYMTGELPYYALDDAAKGLLWHSTSMQESVEQARTQVGGAISAYQGEEADEKAPITSLTFDAVLQDIAAGSRVSLYGIR